MKGVFWCHTGDVGGLVTTGAALELGAHSKGQQSGTPAVAHSWLVPLPSIGIPLVYLPYCPRRNQTVSW